jgi:hypothetical protein
LPGTAQPFRQLSAAAGCLADPWDHSPARSVPCTGRDEAALVEKSLDGAIGIAIKGSLGDDAVLAKIVPLLCQGPPVKQSFLTYISFGRAMAA